MLYEVQTGLAYCYQRLGRPADAQAALQDLLQEKYSVERLGPVRWVRLRTQLGMALTQLNRSEEAEQVLTTAVSAARKLLGGDHYVLASALNQLGDMFAVRGQFDRAATIIQEAHEILSRRLGPQDHVTLLVRANLGFLQLFSGQLQQAVATYSETRPAIVKMLGEKNPVAQTMAFYLATALSESGRDAEAAPLIAGLDPVALTSATAGGEGWDQRLQALKGQVLAGEGKIAEGSALLEAAIDKMQQQGMERHVVIPFENALARIRNPEGATQTARLR
jgi:eukaryotic-like serine/threonine-protein kinase